MAGTPGRALCPRMTRVLVASCRDRGVAGVRGRRLRARIVLLALGVSLA
jgi:hypothetical protein